MKLTHSVRHKDDNIKFVILATSFDVSIELI